MAVYNNARNSGEIESITGNVVRVRNTAAGLNNADVGRLIIIMDGAARRQVRQITHRNGNDLTLNHRFDQSPFPWITEVNPEPGDRFSLSYRIGDLVNIDAQLAITNHNVLTISGSIGLKLRAGVFLHLTRQDIRWNSSNIEISNDAGLILGWYVFVEGEAARPSESCNIVDTAPNFAGDQMRGGDVDFGLFHMYGGGIDIAGEVFWRLYRNGSGTAHAVDTRFIDVDIQGRFGARVDGDRSIIVAKCVNNRSTIGPFNPRSAVPHAELSVINSLQGGYVWLSEGANSVIILDDAIELDRPVRINQGNGGAGGTVIIVAKKSQLDTLGMAYIATGGGVALQHTTSIRNDIEPTLANTDTTAFMGTAKTHLVDATGATANQQTINDGQFVSFRARHTDFVTKTAAGDQIRRFGDPDSTLFAPYDLFITAYGKQTLTQRLSIEEKFNPILTLLDDLTITEADKAIVDAYTELNTAARVYDGFSAWQADHPEKILPITRFGKTLDFGDLDITIIPDHDDAVSYPAAALVRYQGATYSANAVSLGAWDAAMWTAMPLHAAVFSQIEDHIYIAIGAMLDANITTTGTLTTINEAVISGTIADALGVRVRVNLPVNSAISGEYVPAPNVPAIDIPFEMLASGQKIITIPANSIVRLYTKAPGQLPAYIRLEAGEAGLIYAPVQVAMQGNISPAQWVADLTSTAFSANGSGYLDLTFSTLENIQANPDGIKSLGIDDVATFTDAIHFMPNYAQIALARIFGSLLLNNETNQVRSEIGLNFILADTIADNLWLEFPIFRDDDVQITRPKNNHANKVQVLIGLITIDVPITLGAADVEAVVSAVVLPETGDIENSLTTIAGNVSRTTMTLDAINTRSAAMASDVGVLVGDVADIKFSSVNDLIPIKVFNQMPTMTKNSNIADIFQGGALDNGVAVPQGIVRLRRTQGSLDDFVLIFRVFDETIKVGGSDDTGADEFLLIVRNNGNNAETLHITASFHMNDAVLYERENRDITIPAQSGYQIVRFTMHEENTRHIIDEMRLKFIGLNPEIDIEQMGFFKVSIGGGSPPDSETLQRIDETTQATRKSISWPR